LATRSLSHATSRTPAAYELESSELSTVIDQEVEEQEEQEEQKPSNTVADLAVEQGTETSSVNSRSTSASNPRRRKRGARRKGAAHGMSAPAMLALPFSAPPLPPTPSADDPLEILANRSQSLARELSKTSCTSSRRTAASKASGSSTFSSRTKRQPTEPVSMYAVPVDLLGPSPPLPPPVSLLPSTSAKKSKWKLSFGKAAGGPASSVGELDAPPPPLPSSPPHSSPPLSTVEPTARGMQMGVSASEFANIAMSVQPVRSKERELWTRGRPRKPGDNEAGLAPSSVPTQNGADHWSTGDRHRNPSPNSIRSGWPLSSSASSTYSQNWRNSTSSAGASSSAFTRYSNASMRSVSTVATSVSSTSWRAHHNPPPSVTTSTRNSSPTAPPTNVKLISGVPSELVELPRQLYPDPTSVIFGAPHARKPRGRKPQGRLDTITERPGNPVQKPPVNQLLDPSTSTTELPEGDGNRSGKVHKGQITTLAKMLSALRR